MELPIKSMSADKSAAQNLTDLIKPRAQVNLVSTDAAAAKVEIGKVSDDVYKTKSKVGNDLEKIQQTFESSVSHLNEMLMSTGRNLSIGIDKSINGPVVTVRNSQTGEVVRQIPNETVIQIAHSIDAFKGWLHDVQV